MCNPALLDSLGRPRRHEAFRCSNCNEVFPIAKDGVGTGYARIKSGKKVCYACATRIDQLELLKTPIGSYTKAVTLYVNGTDFNARVSNWPGLLKTMVLSVEHCLPHRMSKDRLTKGIFITFVISNGDTADGTYRRLGKFTARLLTGYGNYLSRIRRIG